MKAIKAIVPVFSTNIASAWALPAFFTISLSATEALYYTGGMGLIFFFSQISVYRALSTYLPTCTSPFPAYLFIPHTQRVHSMYIYCTDDMVTNV